MSADRPSVYQHRPRPSRSWRFFHWEIPPDRPLVAALAAMALQPAQPVYILRGHGSEIHAAAFIRSNSRLVTADAEGWIVLWSLAIKRPVAVWKAHEGSILGASGWGNEKLIT